MLLPTVIIVGAIAGVVYKKRHKQQLLKQNKKTSSTRNKSMIRQIQLSHKRKNKSIPLKSNAINSRGEQLEAMSVKKDPAILKQERQLHRNFVIALSSFGLAMGGWLLYTPIALLSLPGILYSSQHTYKRAYHTLVQQKKLNIDVANASVVSLLLVNGYFILTCLPLLFSTVRRKLIAKIKDDSQDAIIDIYKQQPRFVRIITEDNIETELPTEQLHHDMTVVVNAGETIPVDGHILNGTASVDQHILTGESVAVDKTVGDEVFALTVLLSGRIDIRVEKNGQETTAAQIAQILNNTVNIKTNMQLQSERVIDKLVSPVLITGAIALPFIGASNVAGFVNSLPGDNLMISTSINTLNYLNLASKHGVLIKDGRTLELLSQVDTIVFDKTGTLTEDYPYVGQIHCFNDYQSAQIIQIAATAERYQQHPVAKAILKHAEQHNIVLSTVSEVNYNLGLGLEVKVDGLLTQIGSIQFMRSLDIQIPESSAPILEQCSQRGYSVVFVAVSGRIRGMIELEPSIRVGVHALIKQLKTQGIKDTYIISGDQEAATAHLAEQVGVDHYFAEVLPEQKANLVDALKQQGKVVCFIGDGINDTIALKKAHVSISLSGASSMATDTAQVILMGGNLQQLNQLFDLAADFKRKMNFTYGAISIPNIIGVAAILVFHTGFITSIVMNQTGLLLGMGYSTLPLLRHELKRDKIND